MQQAAQTRKGLALDRSKLVVGIILLGFAAVTGYDAYSMSFRAAYGLNPNTASYLVAILLAALGIAHFWSATRPTDEDDALDADWRAIGLIAAALGALVACIFLGAGFILGSTLLFALTARAFDRKAILVDLVIGFVISLAIFFLFNNLLSLTLPHGPLERLL
ncbi:tripartite tricarboxylate transporter TctB family protein [Pelagibacterium sp. H642]|uniref:tripartite tricarboxylate transporter TctB family protein n=1 Tax=Pelagibacterium sp. H642 TaxID=1881069 RepID=UPI002815E49F|nr:tripartite tricarboxylate transporter TctB family protein [Pelagibacterium sp. H642]WMT88985.1 tripartite tricarboxylate transporter TctB family protein [Pelagibacterium sp. H642]